MSEDALKDEILSYLSARNCAVLATNLDSVSHAATMMYFNEGFSLIMATFEETIKMHHIALNRNVAVVVDDQAIDDQNKGIQYIGTARKIDDPEEFGRLMAIYLSKMPEAAMYFEREDICLIRIEPRTIYFTNPDKGIGHRDRADF